MTQVESAAPVIDFEALLAPISEEKPSGEAMQYSDLYDSIKKAREADDAMNLGEWQSELKVADFRKVIELSTMAISTKTKDLQICVWFCEALTKQHGFVGFRDGVSLVRQMQENFWETLHPEIDEGDMEGRANAVEWLNNKLSIEVKHLPLTAGQGLSFFHWQESTQFDFPPDFSVLEYDEQQKFNALKAQAEKESRKTGEMWRAAKFGTNRDFCEKLNLILEEISNELNALDKINEEKYDRNQIPGLRGLKQSIEDIRGTFNKLLEEKREAEPDPIEDEPIEEESVVGEDGETVVVQKGMGVGSGAIQSRADALKRLGELADYFRKTEPHSPVSYLVQRAVKWGNMPLENWLMDVIKDESVISALRQTLGITPSDD